MSNKLKKCQKIILTYIVKIGIIINKKIKNEWRVFMSEVIITQEKLDLIDDFSNSLNLTYKLFENRDKIHKFALTTLLKSVISD